MSVYERLKSWEEALDLLFFMQKQLASRFNWQNLFLVGRGIEVNSCGITVFGDFEARAWDFLLKIWSCSFNSMDEERTLPKSCL